MISKITLVASIIIIIYNNINKVIFSKHDVDKKVIYLP